MIRYILIILIYTKKAGLPKATGAGATQLHPTPFEQAHDPHTIIVMLIPLRMEQPATRQAGIN
jgi:hypothetical protein